MSTIEKISIALTPDLASLVKNAVTDGYYASASEVIREALRDWKIKQSINARSTTELTALWQEGIDSGSAGTLNMEARKQYEESHKITKL